jgi:ribokinase
MAARLIVVGAINVDFVIAAPHLPKQGETVIGKGLEIFGGGKGANAAVAASRAGAQVTLVGAVGADESGRSALDSLQSDGVDISGVVSLDGVSTGAALIVVDENGENQITIGPGANGAISSAYVSDTLAKLLPNCDAMLVSTEIPFDSVSAALNAAANASVPCILNPAPVIPGLGDLISDGLIITPNEIELEELAGEFPEGAEASYDDNSIAKNLRNLGIQTRAPVIATLGGSGTAVYSTNGEIEHYANLLDVEVLDTTGAGDTFNGVFACCLAQGIEIHEAVKTAMIAASLSVRASGAREGMPSADEINASKPASFQ